MSALRLGNALPPLGKLSSGDMSGALLDLLFRDACLWMEQSTLLFSSLASPVPLPVLGFTFQTPDNLVLAKYSYAEYPYLNKAAVANSFLKETGEIEVVGLRPIYKENSVALNYALNNIGIKQYIEKYADRGGTWALNTMWGLQTNLVLTQLEGIKVEGSSMGGVGFKFSFKKLNFAKVKSVEESVSSFVSKLGAF